MRPRVGFNPKSLFKLTVDGPGTKAWTGDSLINLVPYGAVTKLHISLDNSLSASSLAGTSAFIQKKDADALVITITTTEIPEPGTLAMVLVGMAVGGVVSRRRGR